MMYTATARFADLEDNRHVYEVGEVYPREGYTPSEDRINTLLTDKNRARKPLIQMAAEAAAEKQPKKRTKKNA